MICLIYNWIFFYLVYILLNDVLKACIMHIAIYFIGTLPRYTFYHYSPIYVFCVFCSYLFYRFLCILYLVQQKQTERTSELVFDVAAGVECLQGEAV